MTPNVSRIAIRGSKRTLPPNARRTRRSNLNEKITVSIFVRRNPEAAIQALAKAEAIHHTAIGDRVYLTSTEFESVYGASKDDLQAIEKFALKAKLKVVDSSVPKRRVLVEASIGRVEKAFGVKLDDFEDNELGRFRGREGNIYIPRELSTVIVGIEGLDTRPAARSRRAQSRGGPVAIKRPTAGPAPDAAGAATAAGGAGTIPPGGGFWPTQVANLYNYPAEFDGSGQCIAIIAFSGGDFEQPHSGYSPEALQQYFQTAVRVTPPRIKDVVVQGPGNDPGQGNGQGNATDEMMLDLSVTGSVAPGAALFVYFTEFSNQGWIEAILEAITGDNAISVISISYGSPENDPNGLWTASGKTLLNEAFEAAASKGITICCASGDDGSYDRPGDGANADFPASSPWVLGVGGTSLKAKNSRISSEIVWNDLNSPSPTGAGGGGISAVYSLPTYQYRSSVPRSVAPPHLIGRGVPDVAAVADPKTGVWVARLGGGVERQGGTSVSAPLWASLVAKMNQGLGARVGFLNPILYASCSTGVLRDIVHGDNGAYHAGIGWDPCTGLGTPDGRKLLTALGKASAPREQSILRSSRLSDGTTTRKNELLKESV